MTITNSQKLPTYAYMQTAAPLLALLSFDLHSILVYLHMPWTSSNGVQNEPILEG
jgi:hypothetical protein